MNKRDVLMLVLLFGLWLLWAPIDRMFIKPIFFPDPPQTEQAADPEPVEVAPRAGTAPVLAEPAEREPVAWSTPTTTPVTEAEPAPASVDAPRHTIDTELMQVTFTAQGAAIESMVMKAYPQEDIEGADPIVLDFESVTALALEGLAGLTSRHLFEMTPLDDGVLFTRRLDYGLQWTREVRVVRDYVFEVRDTLQNLTDTSLQLPRYGIRTGRMQPMPGSTSSYGMFALGVDTLLPADSVKRWAKDLPRWLKDTSAATVRQPLQTPVDWVAVKNKYFTQSLRPRDQATENCVVYVTRSPAGNDPADVWAALQFPESTLAAGGSFTREYLFYAGPQQHARLSELGFHQDQIMELGWAPIRFFARILLTGLGGIYSVVGNYGVAIMLLTVIIRIIFWPLTHKGTESMRRMQEIAPLMKGLNEKFKDDAQKRQVAMMELYKQHKVNPLGGCLPMLVQIPVFIGLFYVLRTAIELRFAGFLWISDLSEPEGLLADVLPLPLNILPIFMAVTMYFQQKLTPMPSSGDEKQVQVQQMMMRIMPVMMLVLLYNFAAGLALYWSTQNVLMIIQQALYRRRLAHKKAQA